MQASTWTSTGSPRNSSACERWIARNPSISSSGDIASSRSVSSVRPAERSARKDSRAGSPHALSRSSATYSDRSPSISSEFDQSMNVILPTSHRPMKMMPRDSVIANGELQERCHRGKRVHAPVEHDERGEVPPPVPRPSQHERDDEYG